MKIYSTNYTRGNYYNSQFSFGENLLKKKEGNL